MYFLRNIGKCPLPWKMLQKEGISKNPGEWSGPSSSYHHLGFFILQLPRIAEGVDGQTTHGRKIRLDFGVQKTAILGACGNVPTVDTFSKGGIWSS